MPTFPKPRPYPLTENPRTLIREALRYVREARHHPDCRCGNWDRHWCTPREKTWCTAVDVLIGRIQAGE